MLSGILKIQLRLTLKICIIVLFTRVKISPVAFEPKIRTNQAFLRKGLSIHEDFSNF